MTMAGHHQDRYEITIDNDDQMDSNEMSIDNIDPVTTRLKSAVTRRKGRGFSSADDARGLASVANFDTLRAEASGRALRSVEGWVLFLTGLHEEVTEDDLVDRLSDYGPVRDLKLNLDHRTGYVKGYALVEYSAYEQAKDAVSKLDGVTFMDSVLHVDFAFVKPPPPATAI